MKKKYFLSSSLLFSSIGTFAQKGNVRIMEETSENIPAAEVLPGFESVQAVSSGFPVWAGVILVVLCLVLIAGLALVFLKTQSIERKLEDKTNEIKDLRQQIKEDKTKIDELLKSLAIFKNTINEPTISNVVSKNENFEVAYQRVSQVHTEGIESASPHEKKEEIVNHHLYKSEAKPPIKKQYFYGSPQNDLFSRGLEEFKPGYSVYCITDIGGQEASFTIADRKEAKSVIRRSLTRFLEPACDIIGNTNCDFSDIIVRTPGKVKKVAGGWKIIKKAYVELIA